MVDHRDAFRVHKSRCFAGVCSGGVGEHPIPSGIAVQIGLGQHIAGVVDHSGARRQRGQRLAHASQVIHHRQVGQGHAALVFDGKDIVQHVTCGIGEGISIASVDVHNALVKIHADAAQDRHRFNVTDWCGLGRVGQGDVVDVTIAATVVVQIGLGQRVAGQVGLGLAGYQGQIRHIQASQRFIDRHIGQGHIAWVGHHNAVVQQIAHGIDKVVAVAACDIEESLVQEQHRGADQLHGLVVLRGQGLVRIHRGGVLDVAVAATVAVQIGLCQRVAGQVVLVRAGGQGGNRLAQPCQVIEDGDVGQRDGACVEDVDRVIQQLTGLVCKAVVIATRDAGDVLFNTESDGSQQGAGFGVRQCISLVGIRRRCVVLVTVAIAVAVHIGLGQCVAGTEDSNLAWRQAQTHHIQAGGGVRHRHTGQGDVAFVGKSDVVQEHVASGIQYGVAVATSHTHQGLVQRQRRARQQLNGLKIAHRSRLCAVGRGGVLDVTIATAIAVQVLLR